MMKKKLWNIWVALHWLMALLVISAFVIGLFSLNSISDPDQKKVPLQVHLMIGITILLLVIGRYILRVAVYKKPILWNTKGNPAQSRFILEALDKYVHPLLYLATFIMAALGVAISLPAKLGSILFLGEQGSIPTDFSIFPARAWHGAFSTVLLLFVFQHILVAVFHTFIKRDGFIKRMWFKKDRA